MIEYEQNNNGKGELPRKEINGKNSEKLQQKKEERQNQQIIDSYDYLSNAASAQDCTGLIPSEPKNEAERESYEDLYEYQYLPPKFPPEKKVF